MSSVTIQDAEHWRTAPVVELFANSDTGHASLSRMPRTASDMRGYWTSWKDCAVVPLQVYCCNWTPLAVEALGVSMQSPSLSAVKV